MNKKRGILFSSIGASGMVIVIKLIGFVKQMIVAMYYGSTQETDIFFLAYGLINTVSQIAFSSIQVAALILYLEEKSKSQEDVNKLISSILEVFVVLALGISAFTFGFSSGIANILAPTYSTEDILYLSSMIKLFSSVTIFMPIVTTYSTVFNAEKKFIKAQISTLITSVIDILMIVIFAKSIGIWARNWSFIISTVLNACLLIYMGKHFIRLQFIKHPLNDKIVRLLKLSIPIMIGNGMTLILTLIDRTIGSLLTVGNVSALNYASSIYSIIIAVVSSGLVTVLTTYFTEDVAKGKKQHMIDTLLQCVRIVLIPMGYICLVLYILSDDVISIIFMHGEFSANAVIQTSNAAKGYIIAALFVVIKDIFVRGHYALNDTKSPVINNVISGIINIISSVILIKNLAVFGITLGTAIAEFTAMCLCVLSFSKLAFRENLVFSITGFVKSLLKYLGAMGITFVVAFIINNFVLISIYSLFRLIFVVVISLLIYIIFLRLMKCEELNYFIKMVKKNG